MKEESIEVELAGKYLTFLLLKEHYGISVSAILQIIAIPSITPIPKTPEFVKGVINLRGKIIPVIDLRLQFDLEFMDYTDKSSIIIVRIPDKDKELFIGVTVDTVLEVLDIIPEEIENKPSFWARLDTSFILGMAKIKDKVVTLLDIQRILSKEEFSMISDQI